MEDYTGLNYIELQDKPFFEGYIESIENITKEIYQEKSSLRDKVGEIIGEFLYSLKGENRIFCQISGEYLQKPYIFISREYLRRKRIRFFNTAYGFLGGGARYYQLNINDETEGDVIFEVEDVKMLKKLVQKYGDADALALFYIPIEVSEPLEKLRNLFAKARKSEQLEASLLEICDFILIFEADGDSLRIKSSNRTKIDFLRRKVAELNKATPNLIHYLAKKI
ncbi:MAG: hypothetical protein ACE5PV_23705, partial [Candidatus Poribacteria bacterium]